MKKILIMTFLVSSQIWAVQCYFTIAKSDCWKDYDVDVTIMDTNTEEVVQTAHIAKNSPYTRVNFECNPKQIFSVYAQFSPTIWTQDKNKKYSGVRFWAMPETAPQPGTIWGIDICYPTQFSDLPLPKTTISDCSCNFEAIPALNNPIKITETPS